MLRRGELLIYFVVIIFFIFRYAGDADITPRGSLPAPVQDGPSLLIPDDAPLPNNDDGSVRVELEQKVSNGVGTAFAVDDNGTFITARHVVDGCHTVLLLTGPRQGETVLSATSETNRDFAVLKARALRAQPLRVSATSPERGDEGFMMGFPQGKPADVRATVIGRTEMRSSGRYSMQEPVIAWVERERRPGFGGSLGGISGGPVLDSRGHVIGTVVAGAPRRGRVYSTHPGIFMERGIVRANQMQEGASVEPAISRADFDRVGAKLRADHTIAQVYCKAE